MGLKEYRRKRDFKKTAEPRGTATGTRRKSLKYVIQKHDASHLHYDFRLELDGVLLSWAVPKGPSLDPKQKRLAMQVEDHPLDYGNFEGTIPEGEYGAGTVMLWDRGEWRPDTDPHRSLRAGSLKFELKGEKLHGHWALFRMKSAGEKSWLLVKEKDEHAQSLRQGDVLLEKPLSIKTQRDLDDIGAGRKGVNQKAKLSPPPKRTKPKPHRAPAARERQQATERLRNLRLTHPEKVYYPDNDIRKIDILEYYVKASDRLLEHIADRPLMILRYPEGIERKGFVQKHWTRGLPAAIKKRKVRGEAEPYISVDSPEGLIALAQFGVLEIHTWNTTFAHIENPDQWVFDLDPDPHVPWNSVIDTAFAVRDLLKTYGLRSFVKTTGGKGLHVVAPVEPKFDWDLGKAFAKAVCEDIASSNPDLYLVNMSKAKRRGKIFLDYLRNGRGATAVAPYSPRARFGATLSIPVEWTELKRGLKSDAFTIRNIDRRLAKDPWKSFYQIKQVPKL